MREQFVMFFLTMLCAAAGFFVYRKKGNLPERLLVLGSVLAMVMLALWLSNTLTWHTFKAIAVFGVGIFIGFLLGIIFPASKNRPPYN